jgi:hypothetical protein
MRPLLLDRLEVTCRQATEAAGCRRVPASIGVLVDDRGRAEQAKLITDLHARFGSVLHDLGVQPP